MRERVLITCAQMQVDLPHHLDRIRARGYDVLAPPLTGQSFAAAELAELLPGVVGCIAGDDELSSAFFEAAESLRVVIRWGIGTDSVDFAAAAAHGVVVRNTPGVFSDEVADSAFGYVLMLARRHHDIDALVRSGGWPKHEGFTLAGNTLGVIGLGGIGTAVLRRASGFGMKVLGYDPFVSHVADESGLLTIVPSLAELLAGSRVVVLACPATPATYHLINAETLRLMRPDAVLVNVARGSVVNEKDLVEALSNGVIAGAGLDVFESEPLPPESPLRSLPNVVLGAHNGSNTREGVRRASTAAVDYLLEELGSA